MNSPYDIQDLEQQYLSTIDDNLNAVAEILAKLNIVNIPIEQFQGLLNLSAQSLTARWRSGRKVVRTQVAQMLVPDYPDEILQLSLAIDAIVNLLDDLLDEILSKEETGLYILEIARVLACVNQLQTLPLHQKNIANYFNKCICIVTLEIAYREQIKAAITFDERLFFAVQCYDAKSLDMDIFMELPLIQLYGDRPIVDELVTQARTHRAIALIKKDLLDLDHDKANSTETPVVLLSYEGDQVLDQYIEAMMKQYGIDKQLSENFDETEMLLISKNIQRLINSELTSGIEV